jgi:hypothetical protein
MGKQYAVSIKQKKQLAMSNDKLAIKNEQRAMRIWQIQYL